jgi:hypothetical protein
MCGEVGKVYGEVENKKRFTVFAIEEYRTRKNIDGRTAITLFEKSGLLCYIEDFFDVLHSCGAEYLAADFDDYFQNRNPDDYGLDENEKNAWRSIVE